MSIIVIHGDGLPDLLDYLHHDVAANNELLGVQSGIDTTPMLVDKAGNLVDDGTYVYSYDAWNRVIDVHQRGSVVFDGDGAMLSGSPGGFVAGFAYDGLGRLILKERPADETGSKPREHYYYDGVRRIQTIKRTPFFPLPEPDDPDTGVILEPPEGGGGGGGGGKGGPPIPQSPLPEWTVSLEREYVYGVGDVNEFILQLSDNGIPNYVLQDGNLNVVGLTDRAGDLTTQYTYSPYGELVATETFLTAPDNRIGFEGMFIVRLDTENDPQLTVNSDSIYLTPNRTYAPNLGRWLQKDPNESGLRLLAVYARNGQTLQAWPVTITADALYGDGMNLYQFVGSNPITGRDPLGLFALPEFATSSTVRVGLAAGMVAMALTAGALVDNQFSTIAPTTQWGVMGGYTPSAFDMILDGVEGWMTGDISTGEILFQIAEITTVLMAMTQGEALKKARTLYNKSLAPHLTKLQNINPNDPRWNNTKRQVIDFINQVEHSVEKAFKGKTREIWRAFIRTVRDWVEGGGIGPPPVAPG